jgi:hypothetical protein
MKTTEKALLVLLFFGAGGMGTATAALATPAIDADTAPPPAREERAPAPRDGYVWAPGYWDWNGHGYFWVAGRFIFEHRGARWVADRWEQAGSHWQHVNGHWER